MTLHELAQIAKPCQRIRRSSWTDEAHYMEWSANLSLLEDGKSVEYLHAADLAAIDWRLVQ